MAEGAGGRTTSPHAAFRIGYGADVHPFSEGRPLVLGGVRIAHARGLVGHSDADALAHAVCDAILGAMGLPDMGSRFPDHEEANRGRSSLEFLRDVMREARARRYDIVNIDSVLFAEEPHLKSHMDDMRAALAGALECPPDSIGIKAKHCEGLGAIGRREGIMAHAVVLLGPASAGHRPPRLRTTRPTRRRP